MTAAPLHMAYHSKIITPADQVTAQFVIAQ